MNTAQQPEALRLAHALSGGKLIDDSTEWVDTLHDAAAELRHQHARIAELESQLSATQPAAQGLDAETQRHAAIGKAIERACMDLPDGTEISVALEKDAGTVTLIDQDGNEYENFSCDYGFAGVLNEAIDAAMAAHARKEKGIEQ